MNNFVRILFFLGWRGLGKGDGLLLEETDRRKGEKKGPPQGGGGGQTAEWESQLIQDC